MLPIVIALGAKRAVVTKPDLVGRSTGAWIVNSAGKHNHTRDLIRHDKKERSINSRLKGGFGMCALP